MCMVMCSSKYCPMGEECFRKKETPGKDQLWLNYEYKCNENSGFQDFIKYKGDDKK